MNPLLEVTDMPRFVSHMYQPKGHYKQSVLSTGQTALDSG